MKLKQIFGVLILLLGLAAWSPAVEVDIESTDPDTWTLVTWNIEWFPGRFRYARGERLTQHMAVVQEELKRMDPDIFVAQEMRGWQAFADLCSVVPGLQPAVVSAFRGRSDSEYWPQQIGIAAKVPVYAAWSEPWQSGDEVDPPRGFSVAAIQLPTDRFEVLLVYSVHLKSNLADSPEQTQRNYHIREESIRQLLDHIDEMQATFWGRVAGVIVGGDFNTNRDGDFDDRVVDMMIDAGFHDCWQGVPRDERLTWRGSDLYNPTTLDHFFTRGVGTPLARMIHVSDETSDHWPVKITISLADIGMDPSQEDEHDETD